MLAVSRACVLAWEILEPGARLQRTAFERSGLPQMELGLGIAFHRDSAPLYLMDGDHRIMISRNAINESDRPLSSCNSASCARTSRPTPACSASIALQLGGDLDATATAAPPEG